MKKNVRTIVYVMIFSRRCRGDLFVEPERLRRGLACGLDPDSYDVEATCSG